MPKIDLVQILKDSYNNDLVCKKIDTFFSGFDEQLLQKFYVYLGMKFEGNYAIYLHSDKERQKFEIEFDPEIKEFSFRKESVSFDKVESEKHEFKLKLNEIEFGIDAYMTQGMPRLLPEISITASDNKVIDFYLLNQSKSTPIASLESMKNDYVEWFGVDLKGNITAILKSVNSGYIEDFGVKRLINKPFYFVREREYNLGPGAMYPISKTFRKRFVIKHKGQDMAKLCEDVSQKWVPNTRLEILEYNNSGSPAFYKQYADQVRCDNKENYYIKKITKNPYEIMQSFGDERFVPIADTKVYDIEYYPEIAQKIYDRHIRKETRQKNENYYKMEKGS